MIDMKIRKLYLALTLALFTFGIASAVAETPFPKAFSWGKIVEHKDRLELEVETIPANRKIAMPRINNPYQAVYLKSDSKKTPLKFWPEIKEWEITLPKNVEAPTTIVVETVGKPKLLSQPFVIQKLKDGSYLLPAHHSVVHGEKLRYEPQPHKNTVGYWTIEKDWCEWKLDAVELGTYEVHILQGCGKDKGGSEVEIKIGDSRLTFIVEDTGHFQNFKSRNVGKLTISKAGKQTLEIRPVKKASTAVMDVRQVKLVPLK